MNNPVFNKLIQYLMLDNIDDLLVNNNLNKEDILTFLRESNTSSYLTSPIIGNTILTDGNIYTTLKIINDLALLNGNYLLAMDKTNKDINSYLIKRANEIYESLNMAVRITIDDAYKYTEKNNSYITVIGAEEFVIKAREFFKFCNYIIL